MAMVKPAAASKGEHDLAMTGASMTMMMTRAVAALAIAAGVAAAPAQAAVFNAFTSFNGTQGAGSFFYGRTSPGGYVPFSSCGAIDFPTTLCLGSASYPYFAVATSAGPHSGATLPVDRLLTHPGTGVATLLLWGAPVSGMYRVDAVVSLHHPTYQLGNGIGIGNFFVPAGQPTQSLPRSVVFQPEQTFSMTRSFNAGDVYGFSIDANGSNAYDLAGINVIVTSLAAPGVPEPGSWAMLITGFGVVGAAARRRRVARVSA